jgi:hypothetical protein
MPTGYTADIEKGITFQQFVLGCAKAFGACVTMRDDPINKPIPDEFKPSDYHKEELNKAKRKLLRLQGLSPDKAIAEANAEYSKRKSENARGLNKDRELLAKYQTMLKQVRAWQPPSSDHIEFKNFMIQQIETSIKYDCNTECYTQYAPKHLSGKEWLTAKIADAQKDIDYHTKEYKEEIERTNGRNLWVKQLRNSLI